MRDISHITTTRKVEAPKPLKFGCFYPALTIYIIVHNNHLIGSTCQNGIFKKSENK